MKKIRESIALHLLTVIFGFYFIITVIVTVTQLYKEYENTKEAFFQEIRTLPSTFGKGITDSVWTYNKELLQSILQGLYNIPIVVGVEVNSLDHQMDHKMGAILDSNGQTTYYDTNGLSSQPTESGIGSKTLFSHQFPIAYQGPGFETPQPLGSVTIYSNERLVFERVKYGFFLILINSIIKTIALWFIIYFFIKRYLGKPLNEFTEKIKSMNMRQPQPITLETPWADNNEIIILKKSFNEMIYRLQDNQQELLTLNAELDQKVKDRTSELLEAKEEAETLAYTDTLTKMNNRRAFFELGYALLTEAIHNRMPISIIMIDIDYFKSINDDYGHAAGDSVLKAFAQTLLDQIGADDIAGRIGGEEFALVVPKMKTSHALKFAEKIRYQLANLVVESNGKNLSFTVSIGVSELEDKATTLDGILAQADKALYYAKQNGRNRVASYSELKSIQ